MEFNEEVTELQHDEQEGKQKKRFSAPRKL